MDKKKVKELIREVIRKNVDSLEFGNDRHNAPLRKANTLLHDALIELSKSDWIPVEDEPAPRLEWDGSWNDIVEIPLSNCVLEGNICYLKVVGNKFDRKGDKK